MNPTVRPYQPGDKNECLGAFKSNVPQYFTQEEIGDFENFLTKIEQADHNGKTHYYVILNDNKVIGAGGFGDRENSGIISLAWGFIHQDNHRKGFGKLLLSHRLEKISELFPDAPVVIDTTQFSYPFFEKFGFSTTKITNDYYAPGMHRYDMSYK